jgi:hypothetical protein
MPETNNVILFPPGRIVDHSKVRLFADKIPQTIEEVKDNILNEKNKRISEATDSIVSTVSNAFATQNINPIPNPGDIKQCALMIQSITAMICRYYGVNHPFHEIADQLFDVDRNGKLSIMDVDITRSFNDTSKNK